MCEDIPCGSKTSCCACCTNEHIIADTFGEYRTPTLVVDRMDFLRVSGEVGISLNPRAQTLIMYNPQTLSSSQKCQLMLKIKTHTECKIFFTKHRFLNIYLFILSFYLFTADLQKQQDSFFLTKLCTSRDIVAKTSFVISHKH